MWRENSRNLCAVLEILVRIKTVAVQIVSPRVFERQSMPQAVQKAFSPNGKKVAKTQCKNENTNLGLGHLFAAPQKITNELFLERILLMHMSLLSQCAKKEFEATWSRLRYREKV
jgi:hypothetical protein